MKLAIAERKDIAVGTVETTFALAGKEFNFQAGQYIQVILPQLFYNKDSSRVLVFIAGGIELLDDPFIAENSAKWFEIRHFLPVVHGGASWDGLRYTANIAPESRGRKNIYTEEFGGYEPRQC